ncbi:MAG TPA: Zn-ribbon domain-containing OB-fold protein [Stellaceae bacterium]|nr:Zn-ribbon domain-containing OB-fold protein [Stellaceae bacterium]
MAQDRRLIAPLPFPETAPYWEAAARGKLLLKHCTACGADHFYPRALCPFCFSDKTEWSEAKGTGTIYSFSVTRRAEMPYAIAYVTLAEGPTMMSNIVDCDLDAIRIGQRVRLVFKPAEDGQNVPMFTLA